MAKRVVVTRQEFELTDEEAKRYILEKVFTAKGVTMRVEDFARHVKDKGLEAGMDGDLERLVNALIREGKLRIEYEHLRAHSFGGWFLVIKKVV
jgi:hypothetical protein